MPGGNWKRMSPIFLRTVYQTLATSPGLDESLIWKMICRFAGLGVAAILSA
jgi:hypothetical protein